MNITKGCLALVIDGELGSKSPNIGKIVTVGAFLGRVEGVIYNDWWAVDKPMSACKGTKTIYCQREINLSPLDGDTKVVSDTDEIQGSNSITTK